MTVDNTPPQVVLRFDPTRWVRELVPEGDGPNPTLVDGDRDLMVNDLYAAARDDNLRA